ncbi:MAG: heme anaerobic degradation radical SAM methyltransferase ChuW/HutW [Telmatospirillum sp.]|nr:heme anaerobic degradation radical SAM methyltransferase ChuW/HutW [Telmatospirillum sp.]
MAETEGRDECGGPARPLSPERVFASTADPLGAAFPARGGTHMPTVQAPPLAEPEAAYRQALVDPSPGKRSAYLHIPFCANHCLFCGFYRNPADPAVLHDYAGHLMRDVERDGAVLAGQGPVHAVYFGGGTPSALSADDLFALVEAVRAALPLAPDCEITLEGRIAGFTTDKVEACLEAGVNRFSIGIQTFDTGLRRRLGRKASREEAEAFLRSLRDRDRAAVVCDLMFGLPGQTMEMWRRDVATCVALGIDGVDLYGLSLFSKGPLAASIAKGALPPPPALGEMAGMYARGLEILEDAGWRHLTQAHWARTTRERTLYNQFARSGADCLPFGAGAGGMLGGRRIMLDSDRLSYCRRISAGQKPIAAMLPASPTHRIRSWVAAGLETGHLDLDEGERMAGPRLRAALDPLVDQWARAGLIRRRGAAIQPLTAGWFWLGNLTAGLLQVTLDHLGREAGSPRHEGDHHVH